MTTRRSQSLEDVYFEWLCDQVTPGYSDQLYTELFEILWRTPFEWFIPNDDNRVADGLDLLGEFVSHRGLAAKTDRIGGERVCSFLELIVALSRHLAFAAGGAPPDWAWTLLGNLGFHTLSNPLNERNVQYVTEVVDKVVRRKYRRNGVGGLFPLRGSYGMDQRRVELWYQMAAYISEHD